MAGKWNSKNRRIAKLRARDNWFKGSQEVEPPGVQKDGNPEESSRGMDSNQEGEEATERSDQDQSNSMDDGRKDARDSQADQETTRGVERGSSRRMEKKLTKLARKGKKKGPNRQTVTLGGVKRQEKSQRRRTKRHQQRLRESWISSQQEEQSRQGDDGTSSECSICGQHKEWNAGYNAPEGREEVGWHNMQNQQVWLCPDFCPAPTPGGQGTVEERIVLSANNRMRNPRTAEEEMSCTRTSARSARWKC